MSKGRGRTRGRQKRISAREAEQRARNRASIASLELSIAGCAVLRETFGFSAEQAEQWLDQTIAKANKTREEAKPGVVPDLAKEIA